MPNKEAECRKCFQNTLNFSKTIGYGNKMGVVYHYKAKCKNCKTSYMVKRTKFVFEKVKSLAWRKTKQYIKHEKGLI